MKLFRFITLALVLVSSQLESRAGIIPASMHSHISVPQPVIAMAGIAQNKTVTPGMLQDRDPVKKNQAIQRRARVKEAFITTGEVVFVICEIIVEIWINNNTSYHTYHSHH